MTRPYDGGGILRRLRVEVDGQQVAALKQQGSVDLELAAGRHVVLGGAQSHGLGAIWSLRVNRVAVGDLCTG